MIVKIQYSVNLSPEQLEEISKLYMFHKSGRKATRTEVKQYMKLNGLKGLEIINENL